MDETKGTVSGGEFRAPCPAHAETNPSFSINLSSGLYMCFNPDCKFGTGGNIHHFVAVLDDIPVSEAQKKLDEEYAEENPSTKKASPKDFPYTDEHVMARCENLLQNETLMTYVKENMLWTVDTIKKFEIGFEESNNRYWIPVRENGTLVNIRQYNSYGRPKVVSVRNYGTATLFPKDNFANDEVYLVEGEKDCILANQLGLNAITSTGGAGTFFTTWKPLFSNKAVFVCYDADDAGRNGAALVGTNLLHVAKTIKLITLPEEGMDFTDYIKAGNSIQDFMALVERTDALSQDSDAVVRIPDDVTTVTLDKIDKKKLFYKRTKTDVRVIGTESAPFVIPRCMSVTCNKDNGKACYNCRVGDQGGKSTVLINETTPRILDMIECGTREKALIIRDIFEIPACKKYKYTESDHQSISRVSVIPAIDDIEFDEETYNQTYVERELYFIGKSLVANTDYEIETLTVPSPKDQSLVHLGYKVKYADTSVEEFHMTPELHKELEIFQCPSTTKLTTSTPT
jgi:hypothetical protein